MILLQVRYRCEECMPWLGSQVYGCKGKTLNIVVDPGSIV